MTYVHWVLYNLPPDTKGFAESVAKLPEGTGDGLNDWKRTGYGGPCPPIGRHRYFFKLYALDTKLEGLSSPTKPEVLEAMKGHVLAEAQIIGTYQKPEQKAQIMCRFIGRRRGGACQLGDLRTRVTRRAALSMRRPSFPISLSKCAIRRRRISLAGPIPGYKAPRCLLTRQAAKALKCAADDLRPRGYVLKAYDCYRPQRAVNAFVAWGRNLRDEKMKSQFYPEVEKRNLFRDSYIASRSGHSRGSTIDLTIVPIAQKEGSVSSTPSDVRACDSKARRAQR